MWLLPSLSAPPLLVLVVLAVKKLKKSMNTSEISAVFLYWRICSCAV